MKNILIPFVWIGLISCSTSLSTKDAKILFNINEYGVISYKKETAYVFEFTNRGETSLIINDIKASCGCTVPEWPNRPIKPGSKGEIIITYDAASPGTFHKEIKVHYNGSGSQVVLKIKGQVEYPET